LQIVLVGQPELRARLDLPQLRQLKQRIGLRCQVPPLKPGQVRDYIRTRLRVAGASDLELFSPRAISRIAEDTGGVPRLINQVSDHCLLSGYAEQVRRIGNELVDDAIDYLEEGEQPRGRNLLRGWRMTPLRWTLLGTSAAAAALAALSTMHPELVSRASQLL